MNLRKLRWGILSTAEIARKNWKAIQLSGNSTVTAVASRDPERSRRFVAECQQEAPMETAPQALARYADLVTSDAVDAIYVPLPTGLRKEWIMRAAAAGKHVVCEKPCAASTTDLREMIDTCQRHKVQFMDGVMFMHSRRLEKLRQVLNDGETIGEVRRLASVFTFRQAPEFFTGNIRVHSALEPFGCLGDLGWYCLRFALWAKQWQMPMEVNGRVLSDCRRADSPAAVPTAFTGELIFSGGVSADFYCSFHTETEQWVRLSGTRGGLRVEDFVLPFAGKELSFKVYHADFKVKGCDFRMEPHLQRIDVPESSHGQTDAQETNMFRSFAAQAMSGQLNPLWPETALKTQQVMEACLQSARAGGRPIQIGY